MKHERSFVQQVNETSADLGRSAQRTPGWLIVFLSVVGFLILLALLGGAVAYLEGAT